MDEEETVSNPYVTTVVHCAGPNCDKTKGEVNQWWIARVCLNSILIAVWDDNLLKAFDDAIPLCGSQCASKLLSKFMSDQKSKECPANPAKGE